MTQDTTAALGQTIAMKAGFELDVARLNAFLETALDGYAGPLSVKQFEGGQSNPTYLLETPAARYVLRRKPPGPLALSAHAVDREFRVLSALQPTGFPAPRPRVLCTDEAVLGTMFYVMDFVPGGRVFWDPLLPGLLPHERRAIYEDAVDRLADLHGFDVAALGLSDFGKAGSYLARQTKLWTTQYHAGAHEPNEDMNALIAWLPTALPSVEASTLIHGDFGSHNLLLAQDQPKIRAVLDWELSTIGDPFVDLFFFLIPWYRPDVGDKRTAFSNVDREALGIPSLDAMVARYCARTGRTPPHSIAFYCAFNMFRAAAISAGIVARARQGNAAGADNAIFADAYAMFARAAWQTAQANASS